jgi:hypothetical protein
MRFHYGGKYTGNPATLQSHAHEPGFVWFKEATSMRELARQVGGVDLILTAICLAILFIRGGIRAFSGWGIILFLLILVPHEFLHALCFRKEVYFYTNLRQGMLFVTGEETFSKARFIFMSLLPSIVFGLIPFLIFLARPGHAALGTLGALALPSGAGDYYNVFHALQQMPPGSRAYMHGIRTCWYMPRDGKDRDNA